MSISSWWFDPQRALFFLIGVPFSTPLFCLAPCGFTTEYLFFLFKKKLIYPVIYCYCCSIYTWHVFTQSAAAAAAALCVAILLLLLQLQQLLLFVIVCRMAKNIAGSMINLIPSSASCLFIQTRFILDVSLGSTVVAFAVSIRPYYILGNYGDARSQGGRQPASAKSPLYIYAYRALLPLLLLLLLLFVLLCWCCCCSGAAASCCCSSSSDGWPNLVLVH